MQHHPLEEFATHLTLEGLVEANMDRLDKPRAIGRDELNLHAKGLDGVDNQPILWTLNWSKKRMGMIPGGAIAT